MIFTINSDNLIATIDSCGAQLLSVVANGKQRLWQNDDGSWSGHLKNTSIIIIHPKY